jgi:hypothetical protein
VLEEAVDRENLAGLQVFTNPDGEMRVRNES